MVIIITLYNSNSHKKEFLAIIILSRNYSRKYQTLFSQCGSNRLLQLWMIKMMFSGTN